MSRVYWDTMIFVYVLESHPEFGDPVLQAYKNLIQRGDTICTSVFTLGEILVKPKAAGDIGVQNAIRDFMLGSEIELLPFDAVTADRYSSVRAGTKLKAADAIHLATAVQARVNLFMTNDQEIRKQVFPDLPLMVGLDGQIF
jgi:predicted nucleic acid-binding protein